MKIAIFGINHVVSYVLAQLHLNEEDEVYGVYNQQYDSRHSIHFLNNSEFFSSQLEFDIIYIIAAYVPRGEYDTPSPLFKETNINLPKRISQKFRNSRIVYLSSVAVYGVSSQELNEQSEVKPDNLYSRSKAEAEQIIQQHPSYSVVRLSSLYGLGLGSTNFIMRAIEQAKTDKEILQFGDGTRIQNYIHIKDAAHYLKRAGQLSSNQELLALGEESYSNAEVLRLVSTLSGSPIKQVGVDNSPSILYNNAYSCRTLGFKPLVSLQEGILEIIKNGKSIS